MLFIISLVGGLLSCENAADSALTTPKVDIDLDSIKSRGYITALVDNNSISYFLYKGQSMGYDYELLQRMAKDLGVRLKLKRISGVENAIRILNAGEADVLAFPLTITSERRNYVSFTQPQNLVKGISNSFLKSILAICRFSCRDNVALISRINQLITFKATKQVVYEKFYFISVSNFMLRHCVFTKC